MDSNCHELQNLEETITGIVVELLLMDKEKRFPDLLLKDVNDKTAVRATMHYVRALLSYGFSPDTTEFQKIIDWFDRPFPQKKNDHVDPQEMNRLMVLLLARPESDGVQARLEQLGRQKVEDGFDVQPGWGGFDTLWALEIFALAIDQKVLRETYVKQVEVQGILDRLITKREVRRDKDVALALRLQHQHFGGLQPAHEAELERLIKAAETNRGVWGLEELGWLISRMEWLDEFVGQNKLLPKEVREYDDQFRRVILSTCMVVENLAPLRPAYPALEPVLDRALKLWWHQFEGPHAITRLRNLFPKPQDFDYLRVLCRSLRAVRAYVDSPLGTLNSVQVHVLNELAEIKKDLNESQEVRNIKAALRSWIQIDLEREVETLKLGFSEANVVRVHPRIWSPMASANRQSLGSDSVIIKYGPRDEIERERQNYSEIPSAIRDHFVRIPQTTYADLESGIAYVIMQDLQDFRTLYEVHEEISRNLSTVGDQLGTFLLQMHQGGSNTVRPVRKSLMREAYLRKMMEYIDRIFDFVWDYQVFANQPMVQDIQHDLFDCIGDLIQRQSEIRDFPAAHMHGDLHMRNIMVHGLEGRDSAQSLGLTFKLIDLEYLKPEGDAAFDAGQLLIDIELVSREERQFDSQERLLRLRDHLQSLYQDFGETRHDATFGMRVELAKARALLRIAKGKTKRGSQYVREKQSVQAEHIAEEVIAHAAEALQYLQTVSAALS